MQSGSTTYYAVRIAAFVLHFVSALFIGYTTLRCGSAFVTNSYAETVPRDSARPSGYAMLTQDPCLGPSCFYAVPQTYEVAQPGLEWNVFALLTAFEWISAGFALWHLDPRGPTRALLYLWNLAGVLLLMPYSTHLSLLQTGLTLATLLAATAAQTYPVGLQPGHVAMHYAEYCTSASLLFVVVLILFVPDPPSWACVVGFMAMLLCNLAGVDAHLSKLDQPEEEGPLRPPLPASSMDFNWTALRNHFKLFLLHSWLALAVAIACIVYLSQASLTDPNVPWWVRLLFFNLLITYCLFGVWATACYAIAEYSSESGAWIGETLGSGLTVLSAAAKLPVVYTVFYGLLKEPGQPLCSV